MCGCGAMVHVQSDDTVTFSYQDKYSVAVTFNNFRVDFFVGDDLAVTLNRQVRTVA